MSSSANRQRKKMLRIGDATTEVVFVGEDYRNIEPTYEKVIAGTDVRSRSVAGTK